MCMYMRMHTSMKYMYAQGDVHMCIHTAFLSVLAILLYVLMCPLAMYVLTLLQKAKQAHNADEDIQRKSSQHISSFSSIPGVSTKKIPREGIEGLYWIFGGNVPS